jgi:hypothetical protein
MENDPFDDFFFGGSFDASSTAGGEGDSLRPAVEGGELF